MHHGQLPTMDERTQADAQRDARRLEINRERQRRYRDKPIDSLIGFDKNKRHAERMTASARDSAASACERSTRPVRLLHYLYGHLSPRFQRESAARRRRERCRDGQGCCRWRRYQHYSSYPQQTLSVTTFNGLYTTALLRWQLLSCLPTVHDW